MRTWEFRNLFGVRSAEADGLNGGIWQRAAAKVRRSRAKCVRLQERVALDFSNEETSRVIRWLETARETASPFFQQGAQGGVYVCDAVSPPVIIKAPARKGLRRRLDVFFLRREYRAYRRLRGVRGIPKCRGLLQGCYLVLEQVSGVPRHKAVFENERDREMFFAELFDLICEMHRRGVAHGDLQNKNNLLVVDGAHPCVLDFGAAQVREAGALLPGNVLFGFLSRLDFNVWVKLKYAGRMGAVSEMDRCYYRRTWVEKAARWTKETWKRLKGAS